MTTPDFDRATTKPSRRFGDPDSTGLLSGTSRLGQMLRQNIASHWADLQTVLALVLINFFEAALGFVTRVKIANVLGRADFGLFSYGLALAGYATVIVHFGLDRTLVRDLIHAPAQTGRIVAASIILRAGLFLGLSTAMLLWKAFGSATGDFTWGVLLLVFGGSMIALDLRAVYDSWGRMIRHAVYYILSKSVFLAFVWLVIILLPASLSIFWIGFFTLASAMVYLFLQYAWALPRIDFSHTSAKLVTEARHLAGENAAIWVSTIAGLVVVTANQILLKIMGGKEALGIYGAAWVLVSLATLFLAQISRLGTPASARITQPDIRRRDRVKFLVKYSVVALVSVFPISIASILFPTAIVKMFYAPEYASAIPVLQILGVYLGVYSTAMVPAQYVVACRREWHYLFNVLCGGIANVSLCFFLIPRYTATGAALALLVSHSLTMCLNYATAAVITIRAER